MESRPCSGCGTDLSAPSPRRAEVSHRPSDGGIWVLGADVTLSATPRGDSKPDRVATNLGEVVKNGVMQVWEPRVGPQAAAAYWDWYRWTVFGRFAVLLFIVVFAVGVHFDSLIVEVASYLLPVGAVVGAFVYQPKDKRRFAEVASQALGVPIKRGNFPPRTDAHYAEWCAKNGITVRGAGPTTTGQG